MTLRIDYSVPGRGAWPASVNTGGTLNLAGNGPGKFYRSATGDATPIGLTMYNKHVSKTVHDVHINEVATWRAAMALQKAVNAQAVAAPLIEDGIWGVKSDLAFRAFQEKAGVFVDGIVGPTTSKALFLPMLEKRVVLRAGVDFMRHQKDFMVDLCSATIALESGWDPGAVGYTTPRDLGISQINTAAHTDITWETAFDPNYAFTKKLSIIKVNFDYVLYDIILAIASYNGGLGGASNWHAAGRPVTNDRGELVWAAKYLKAVANLVSHPDLVSALTPWKDI